MRYLAIILAAMLSVVCAHAWNVNERAAKTINRLVGRLEKAQAVAADAEIVSAWATAIKHMHDACAEADGEVSQATIEIIDLKPARGSFNCRKHDLKA